MALRPVLTNVDAFDATKGTTFYFSWKGAQVSSNRLIITDSETGREVYNYKSVGMKLSHVMDLVKNDAEYYISVKTCVRVHISSPNFLVDKKTSGLRMSLVQLPSRV